MSLPKVLLETVDNLIKNDLKKLKWIKPIHRELIDTHGDEMAVNVTAEVLKKLGRDNDARKLKKSYAAAGNTAAPSTSTSAAAPPAALAPPPAAPAPPPAAPVETPAAPLETPAAPVETPAAPVETPAVPASMMAHEGGIIFAPNITGGTTGTWNININK